MPERWSRDAARETPVTDGCLFCGIAERDAEDDVEYVPVGDDERLCDRCRADLREFTRSLFVQLWCSRGLDPAVRRVVQDAWRTEVQPELSRLYREDDALYQMPEVLSDAAHHVDPGLDDANE